MPETTKKGRTATYILLGVGLVILATAGIALYPGFVENNLIRTMASKRTGEVERAAAARRLADLGSVRAIPGLIRAAAGFLDEEAGQRNSFTSFQAQITSLLKSRERLVQAQQAALQAEAAQGVRPGGGNVGINRTRRQSVFMLAQIKTIDSRLERFLDNVDSMFVGDAFFESLRTIVSSMGRKALPYLLPELDREEEWQRKFIAIRLLRETGAEAVRAVEKLKATLDSEHPLLRYAAQRALDAIERTSVEVEDSIER